MDITRGQKTDKYGNPLSRRLFIFALLLIPMLNFVVFTIYANFGGVFLSLKQFRNGEEIWVGLENFQRFFRDFETKEYGRSIVVSLMYLLVVGGISLPVSLLTAFFLYKKIPLSRMLVVILYIPNIIPGAVMAEFYRRMWDSGGGVVSTGLLNRLFSFVEGREINWLTVRQYANQALWIYTVWFGFGFNAILLWGAMTRVPPEIVESAELDGAGIFTEFFRITIPVIWSTLSMVIVLTATVPFTVYMQPLLIANNGDVGTRTIALLAMQELKRPDPYFSAAIYILIACVSLPTVLIVKRLTDKAFETVEV